MSIYVVEAEKLISAIADKLREFKEITPPNGSEFWKTAFFKELAPIDHKNFWYIRCASLLRKVKAYSVASGSDMFVNLTSLRNFRPVTTTGTECK